MKKTLIGLAALAVVFTAALPSYASDWDKAGKVLTVIEGIRVLTGGNVDIIGTVTGINRREPVTQVRYETHSYSRRSHREVCYAKRVWVPHYVWKKKYVPRHREYCKQRRAYIIVEGHYEKYKVERGGHWEYQCTPQCRHEDRHDGYCRR